MFTGLREYRNSIIEIEAIPIVEIAEVLKSSEFQNSRSISENVNLLGNCLLNSENHSYLLLPLRHDSKLHDCHRRVVKYPTVT
jgi:hypothetical protein